MFIQQIADNFFWRNSSRKAAAFVGFFACCWLAVAAATMGVSRFLSDYGLRAEVTGAVDKAASLRADDAEAPFTRAMLFTDSAEFFAAARKLEQAIALRPRDHFLWVELGLARDQAGETEAAIAAFKEATRLAPYYAQPRWQLGNLLVRAGRYEEAFSELRGAIASNPELFPNAIDLAFGVYAGDIAAVELAIQPNTPAAQFALARILAKRGKAKDALRLFRAIGQLSAEQRQSLLTDLFDARQFSAAYDVWASGFDERAIGGRESVIDGGFESEIRVGTAPAFGWRIERDQKGVKAFLSAREPQSGARSLILEWSGDPPAWTTAVSQVMLVSANTRYRLSFWARAEDLVTAVSPLVTIHDSANSERPLALSVPLIQMTHEWRQYSVQFQTGTDTQAVTLAVRREACASPPCPIFGRIWLDDFALSRQ